MGEIQICLIRLGQLNRLRYNHLLVVFFRQFPLALRLQLKLRYYLHTLYANILYSFNLVKQKIHQK